MLSSDNILCAASHRRQLSVSRYATDTSYWRALVYLDFRLFRNQANCFGGGKLLIKTLLYYLPLQMIYDVSVGVSTKTLISDCLFLSHGPYWFIRTYLLFYLFVPIVNKFLSGIENKQRVYAVVILAFINFWFGCISHGDASLIDGKNIVNFTFLYIVGDSIRYCSDIWRSAKVKYFIFAYLLLNIGLQITYNQFYGTIISKAIFRLSYAYNSPVLLLNAILLFLCFAKINITSSFVNRISASVFSAYLITDQPFVRVELIGRFVNAHVACLQPYPLLLLAIVVVAAAMLVVSILIDQTIQPLWRRLRFTNLDAKLAKYIL